MEEQNVTIVKTALQLDYYDKFQCSGSACQFTCCQLWDVHLTKKDYTKVRGMRKSPEMQKLVERSFKRIKDADERKYAKLVFDENKTCPLLSAEGWCSLQKACGYAVLPEICKVFPRVEAPTLTNLQRSCSTGCEAVVRLLLERKDGLEICHVPMKQAGTVNESREHAYAEDPLLQYLDEIQGLAVGILKNRSYSIENRLILLGLVLRDLDELRRKEDWAAIPQCLAQKNAMAQGGDLADTLDSLPSNQAASVFANCLLLTPDLTVVHDEPRAQLKNAMRDKLGLVFQSGAPICSEALVEVYRAARSQCEPFLKQYEYLFENLMVNHLFTMAMPFSSDSKEMWNRYASLCMVYNFIRFAVICLDDRENPDRLIHVVTVCSRMLDHNMAAKQNWFRLLKEMECDTLAHMAAMVKG